jgi:hypothetical protein
MPGEEQSETWSPGIEFILEEIRLNSIDMSNYHKDKYYYFKGYLKYFRIPTILFSAMNSVFSVGLQPYCPQPTISLLCCLISLICGVISSIELFLSIQNTMENELTSSKDFYLLSVDVFKMLSLERNTRMVNGKIYLDETYQTYCKLIENSNLVNTEIKNMITPAFQPNPKLFSMTKAQITDIEMPPISTVSVTPFETTNEELYKSFSHLKPSSLKKKEIKAKQPANIHVEAPIELKPTIIEEEKLQSNLNDAEENIKNNVIQIELTEISIVADLTQEPELDIDESQKDKDTDPELSVENIITEYSDNVVLDIDESNNENIKTKRKYIKKIKT